MEKFDLKINTVVLHTINLDLLKNNHKIIHIFYRNVHNVIITYGDQECPKKVVTYQTIILRSDSECMVRSTFFSSFITK